MMEFWAQYLQFSWQLIFTHKYNYEKMCTFCYFLTISAHCAGTWIFFMQNFSRKSKKNYWKFRKKFIHSAVNYRRPWSKCDTKIMKRLKIEFWPKIFIIYDSKIISAFFKKLIYLAERSQTRSNIFSYPLISRAKATMNNKINIKLINKIWTFRKWPKHFLFDLLYKLFS